MKKERENFEANLANLLRQGQWTVATAESCSGGLLGVSFTDRSGSSDYYIGGVVSYANEAKEILIGVKEETLKEYGAVSPQVALEMAEGIRDRLRCDWGLSTTGIAGPGGGSEEKPVGLVFIGLVGPEKRAVEKHLFVGTRKQVRRMTVTSALKLLEKNILEITGNKLTKKEK